MSEGRYTKQAHQYKVLVFPRAEVTLRDGTEFARGQLPEQASLGLYIDTLEPFHSPSPENSNLRICHVDQHTCEV